MLVILGGTHSIFDGMNELSRAWRAMDPERLASLYNVHIDHQSVQDTVTLLHDNYGKRYGKKRQT